VDTPEQQIGIALQKAGIPKGEKYTLERFEWCANNESGLRNLPAPLRA
jgi:hypothetical protein